MAFFRHGAESLRQAGCRTFWFGPVSAEALSRDSELLGVSLPDAFVEFVLTLGGGGVEGAEINGVDPGGDVSGGGTFVAATRRVARRFGIQPNFIVLSEDEGEWAECLDCGSGRVVGFEIGGGSDPMLLARDFREYFQNYVADQIAIERDS